MSPHKSIVKRAGRPPWAGGRGEVIVWLSQSNGGPVWLNVLAAHGASATVQIPISDGAQLRDGLTELLRQAAGTQPHP